MGSCDHFTLVHESVCGSPHLAPAGEAVAERLVELIEVKSEVGGTSCCQEFPAKGFDVSSELHLTPGSPRERAEQEDELNDSNSTNDSSGKSLLDAAEEGGLVDTSSQILPSQGCGMPVEVHSAGSPRNCASVNNSFAERVVQDVLEKCDLDSRKHILFSQNYGDRQNLQKESNDENVGSAETVMELMEEKNDVVNGAEIETYIQRSLVEDKSGNLMEGSFNIALDYPVEKSISPQSCQVSSSIGNGPSKRLDVSDFSETIGGLDSSITIDCSDRTENEGRDKGDFDCLLKPKIPELLSSPRTIRRIKSSTVSQKEQVIKRCRKNANKVPHSHEILEILSKASRRKRSCVSKPARSSVWGHLGRISKSFEGNNQLGVNRLMKQGSEKGQKARGGRGNGKHNQSQEGEISLKSKGKHPAVTTRIRLRVKVGKEVVQNSRKVIAPEVENASAPTQEVRGDHMHEFDLSFSRLAEDKLRDEGPAARQFQHIKKNPEKVELHPDAYCSDAHLADKDLESTVTLDKSADNAAEDIVGTSTLFQVEVEALREGIQNRCLDPGTSPDSEVINQIPEAQLGVGKQELSDTLVTSSNLVAPRDVKNLNMPRMRIGKGRKKDKFSEKVNCTVDPMSGPSSLSKHQLGFRKKFTAGFNSDETFALSSRKVANKTSSDKGMCTDGELFPLLKEAEFSVRKEALAMRFGCEDNSCTNPNVVIGLIDYANAETLLPPPKSRRHKSSPRLKSGKVSKSWSEGPSTEGSKRGDARRQKASQRKSANKNKVNDTGLSGKVVCKMENNPELVNPVVDAIKGGDVGDKAASEEKIDSEIVPSGVVELYLPPRNAWVRCDECHKWRRIPTTLADSIEETNCKWTCKDNMDNAYADCSIPQEKSNAEINVELEISDASCEEDANNDRSICKEVEQRYLAVSQQSPWTLIKSNLFLHRRRRTQTIDEIMVCHCKPLVDGRLGCGDECLNRILNIECVRGMCPCGDRCSNQQFQKRKYAKLKSFRCGKKGYGLQLLENISKGQFLIEYVGEVLDLHAYEARQKEYASRGHKHFYFMTLNGSEVIDACAKGNLGRFINHSCDPNCRTEKWMVNGEICIGLFAIRDIKKGEEVTFDYNYVRVFGAAAKKCVCGSSQCRGYIGGDPSSTEVIVQGDSDEEYPEPVMLLEDGESFNSLGNIIPKTSGKETQTAEVSKIRERDLIDESANTIGQLEITAENEDSMRKYVSSVSQLRVTSPSVDSNEKLPSSIHQGEVSLLTEDRTSKPISTPQQEIAGEQEAINKSLFSVKNLETSVTTMSGKSFSDNYDADKKSQFDMVGDNQIFLKSRHVKISKSSSSVKKGKHKSNLVTNKSQLISYKPKKVFEGSDNGRFEAVQEKLSELLDADGGISKRKDATKGYLKLLLLTAASGDRGNGEAIQSNRDLSMILDALLKTKSRTVLVDIIDKNGLQMLHNTMKQYRKDYNKTPILRKLLKVLEYLAAREILTLEHMNRGPPCPGMESLRESILTLTEHSDKQVHQIARNFRDKWYPRPFRKFNCMERDDGRVEFYKGSGCSRFSASHNYWRDESARPIEAIDCIKQSAIAATSGDAGIQEGRSALHIGDSSTNGSKIRKRKSRWDQPAESNSVLSPQCKEQKFERSSLPESESSSQFERGEVVQSHVNEMSRKDELVQKHSLQDVSDNAGDRGQNMHEDFPPGFSFPLKAPLVSPSTTTDIIGENGSHSDWPFEVVLGHVKEKFISRLPVSYGIPQSILQQFGIPEAESVGSWVTAPGIPFYPFPPLPPYPRDRRNPSPCAVNSATVNQGGEVQRDGCGSATYHMDQSTPSTSGVSLTDPDIGTNSQYMYKRARGGSYDLGKRFFRQQKWNNPKLGPPWLRKRNGCGFMGNNSRSGGCNVGMGYAMNEVKIPYSSEDVSSRKEGTDSTFYQHTQYHNQR